MEIYIIRHGETLWNVDKKLQGHSDIELNENGRALAFATGQKLRGIRFDRVYSSPLKRALDTAELILDGQEEHVRPEIIADERLIELSFGVDEGVDGDTLIASDQSCFRYFFSEPEKYFPSEGGETLEEVVTRVGGFMKEVIEPMEGVERVLITGHGAMNKAIMSYVDNRAKKDFWKNGLQDNCGIIILSYENGRYTIVKE